VAGIPPLSGFISKFGLIEAGVAKDEYVIVAVSLVVTLLTLFSMVRIWIGVFWSPPEESPARPPVTVPSGGGPALMVVPTAALVICSLAVAVAAGPIYAFSESAARDLIDRTAYIDQVLDP
jgi:multicomponent Na+:H+ antiporter subunit D